MHNGFTGPDAWQTKTSMIDWMGPYSDAALRIRFVSMRGCSTQTWQTPPTSIDASLLRASWCCNCVAWPREPDLHTRLL